MENSKGERITKAGPSSAVVLLGLAEVPAAGDVLRVGAGREDRPGHGRGAPRGRDLATRGLRPRHAGGPLPPDPGRPDQGAAHHPQGGRAGLAGRHRHALEQIQTDEVRINVLHEGTGDITDNDILLASASDAIVVGFNTKLDRDGAPHGRGRGRRGPPLRHHLPADRGHGGRPQGPARARRSWRSSRAAPRCARSSASARRTVIAGCYVTDGRIVRGGARVYRGGKLVATDRIESLRRFRDDVREVATGYECGIGLADFHDLEEGDIIEMLHAADGLARSERLSVGVPR